MITIIDYGLGNLGSIQNMIKRIGFQSIITSNPNQIKLATKLILPGIGSFDEGMNNLKELKLIDILNQKVLIEQTPILGICLGMQLFSKGSEEGTQSGFNWIEARFKKFDSIIDDKRTRIPNIGWHEIIYKNKTELFNNSDTPRFYFVHSYHATEVNKAQILCTSYYGYEFVSGFIHKNIIGVQFHPEKSHKFGMDFLTNFCLLKNL